VFAHTAHIQLLMTAGLPFSLLAFHRMADRPSVGRGAALGGAMAAQAICCGYYGVFVCLMVGFAILVVAATRRLWTDRGYWIAIAVAAVVAILLVTPAFLPYAALQREGGFRRELKDAVQYSASWSDYLASSSYAHAWMLRHLPAWTDVSFPGFVITLFGVVGAWIAARDRRRELLLIYGGLALLAFWASFGPTGVLYSALYDVVPMFTWMRAPARFGLIVGFGLSVLAGVAISAWLRQVRRPGVVTAVLVAVAAGDLAVPLHLPEVPPVAPVYLTLATLPRGPLIETPFFYPQVGLFQHTKYMLASTAHWDAAGQRLQRLHPAGLLRARAAAGAVSQPRRVQDSRAEPRPLRAPSHVRLQHREPQRRADAAERVRALLAAAVHGRDDEAVRDCALPGVTHNLNEI